VHSLPLRPVTVRHAAAQASVAPPGEVHQFLDCYLVLISIKKPRLDRLFLKSGVVGNASDASSS
jgi:hypothetical protein